MKRKRFITMLLTVLMSITVFAQKISYKGTVTDERGEPILGATVLQKCVGKTGGVITDLNGNVTILADQGATVLVSYIGDQTMDTKVAQNICLVTKDETNALNDVI